MEKIFLESKEQWYQFCKANQIGDIHRQFNTQWCNIFGGEKSDFRFEYNGKLVNVPQDPTQYPCIFVYHKMSYNQFGMFIYKDDWKKDFENTGNNTIDDDLGSPWRKHILDD